jgi:hypothetical protein
MFKSKDMIWWYWLITDVLLIMEVSIGANGLALAIALTLVQVVHFYRIERAVSGFATQVRIAYLLLLVLALWQPLYELLYLVIIGTSAMVLVNYCFLARFMSLMPWNHDQAFSWAMMRDTFFSKPVTGSVKKR